MTSSFEYKGETFVYQDEETAREVRARIIIHDEADAVWSEYANAIPRVWGMNERAREVLLGVTRWNLVCLLGMASVVVALRLLNVPQLPILFIAIFAAVGATLFVGALTNYALRGSIRAKIGQGLRMRPAPRFLTTGRWERDLDRRIENIAIARLKARGELPETYARSA